MMRLPPKCAPFIYGVVQAAVTTAVATAIATHQWVAFSLEYIEQWLAAWLLAWLTMLPVVVFASPFIQRCVAALTAPAGARDEG